MADLFITEEELAALCHPFTRAVAMHEKLTAMGIRSFLSAGRKKHVSVTRGAYEAWKNPPPPPAAVEPRWVPPPPPPWEQTALGRWQAKARANRRAREAEDEAEQPTPAQARAMKAARVAAVKERHAAVVRFHASKRRCLKLQRTPPWADMDAIKDVYLEARRRTTETGVPHHVDHQVPLQGELVSGLHVPNNLQILTGSENSKKRNRFEIEP